MSLKERIHEVKGDSEEAFRARRKLVRLLVEGIIIEDKRRCDEPRVCIACRFDEHSQSDAASERRDELCEVSRNTDEFLEVKARAGR